MKCTQYVGNMYVGKSLFLSLESLQSGSLGHVRNNWWFSISAAGRRWGESELRSGTLYYRTPDGLLICLTWLSFHLYAHGNVITQVSRSWLPSLVDKSCWMSCLNFSLTFQLYFFLSALLMAGILYHEMVLFFLRMLCTSDYQLSLINNPPHQPPCLTQK